MNKRSLQDLSYSECLQIVINEGGRRGNEKGKFLCPLHSEKTPSFSLNEGKDGVHWFYCFGCNKGGNMINFLNYLGYSYSEACKKLNIESNQRWDKTETQIDVIEQVQNLMINQYKDLKSKNFTLYTKDIFVYQAPNKNYKTYYKCIFRNQQEKQPRFCYFDDNNILQFTAPRKQMPYNFCDALEWKKNRAKGEEHRKIIITEGEKDVETIKNTLQNYYSIKHEKYVPISLKGLTKEAMGSYLSELLETKKTDEIVSIYFIGDNDLAGREYMETIFFLCNQYVDNFFLVELPLIYRMKEGSDITDWVNYMSRVEKKSLIEIREIFFQTIKNHHWDYKKSQCWAVLDEKDKPVSCWQNIASFFQYKKCNMRYEVISGKVHKNLGALINIQDETNASHGICYNSLKSEMYFHGLHIKKSNEIYEHLETFLKKRRFIEMLEVIASKPLNQNFVKYNFSENNNYDFGTYYLAPLLVWLLNNISFQSDQNSEKEFQKIMIFKALLACPYMLRNEGGRRLRGDLRFVSGNQKGKSTFCRELFGATLTDYTWYTQCTLLDVTSRDSKKNALIAPCVILDEGNLKGGKNTSIKEIRAFYDESIFSFIDKFEKNRTEIVRKSILISSSNSKQNSIDIESERRLWQVEIDSLPFLSQLKKDIYCKTPEQQEFWSKYGIHSDNYFAFFEKDGEQYFQFPLLEFWKEMNYLYEFYENQIDTVIEFSQNQLRFYKECWMQGKYMLFDTQIGLEDLHAEHWNDPETVKISNEHFNIILQHSKTLTPRDHSINKNYRALALSKNRTDIDPDIWLHCSKTKKSIRGKKIPYISIGKANYMKSYYDQINQSMPFDPYQYCCPKLNNKTEQAELYKHIDGDGFPKKNSGTEV
jgi:hypothetical protein